jgi:hypothetical protein
VTTWAAQSLYFQCSEACNPLFTHHQPQRPSCLSSESILKGVTNFWQKIVYAKLEFQKWHALDYIKGKCPDCDMNLLKFFSLEKDLEHETFLNWKCFQEVLAGMTKIGQPKIVIRLEHIQNQCLEYLDFMGPKLQQFVIHNFVVTWQDC